MRRAVDDRPRAGAGWNTRAAGCVLALLLTACGFVEPGLHRPEASRQESSALSLELRGIERSAGRGQERYRIIQLRLRNTSQNRVRYFGLGALMPSMLLSFETSAGWSEPAGGFCSNDVRVFVLKPGDVLDFSYTTVRDPAHPVVRVGLQRTDGGVVWSLPIELGEDRRSVADV